MGRETRPTIEEATSPWPDPTTQNSLIGSGSVPGSPEARKRYLDSPKGRATVQAKDRRLYHRKRGQGICVKGGCWEPTNGTACCDYHRKDDLDRYHDRAMFGTSRRDKQNG